MVPILSFELISTAMTSEQGVLFPDTEDTSEVSVSEQANALLKASCYMLSLFPIVPTKPKLFPKQ